MTPPENGKPLWNESQVASLLEEFFQREMPADLRNESPELPPGDRVLRIGTASREPLRISQGSKPSRPRSIAGVLVVGFSSMLMVLVALLYWNDPPADPQIKSPGSLAGPEKPESRRDGVVEALEHDGKGPVETRPWMHSVGQGNPGEIIEFPELDIEVFPLDRNFSNPDEPNDRPLPGERSSHPENSPMPEENRDLPESRLPESSDPDEADDAPLLPEFQADPIEFF